ncbi:MAG: 2-oxoglutarate dehydrogenase complex dihydrolipoyllysine-residue succinyltransferase [Bdellovibrionota bacterium]
MIHEIVAPTVGESISEVRILAWSKKNGEYVKNGETVAEIESDKATVEVIAENNGTLKILEQAGEMIAVGKTIAQIDDTGAAGASSAKPEAVKTAAPAAVATKTAAPAANAKGLDDQSPAVRKILAENGTNPTDINGTGKGGRITKGDAIEHAENPRAKTIGRASDADIKTKDQPGDRRVPMSLLRMKIAERLKQAQNTAAMLTTFNEVDLSKVVELRKQFKDKFKTKYGVGLGYMSFFSRAAALALKEFEAVNATLDGSDIIYHDYVHMGIAVGTDRGLVVPVLRNVDKMTFAQIEQAIVDAAGKAKSGKLGIADMSGGTFTVTNGGTYGSMLSTPILNPPQSAILGMHNIQDRAVVIEGKIEIRPMMYLAVSYDHRIIDGKEAVSFLVAIKKHLENPEELGLEFKKEI